MSTAPELGRTELQELADLARLTLPPERLAALQQRLAGVLEAFSALAALPRHEVSADAHVAGAPLRSDEPEAPLPVAAVLANAPATAANMFLVPRVVEG